SAVKEADCAGSHPLRVPGSVVEENLVRPDETTVGRKKREPAVVRTVVPPRLGQAVVEREKPWRLRRPHCPFPELALTAVEVLEEILDAGTLAEPEELVGLPRLALDRNRCPPRPEIGRDFHAECVAREPERAVVPQARAALEPLGQRFAVVRPD